tara:strand:+ start:256490 stop:256996 length:507 start_codon:yes stop_codon:yes gene_type:complete
MAQDWHLAQLNVGTIKYPQDDPRMSGFMNRLDEINALAETSPGFIWRLQSDSGNATDIDTGRGPLFIANMSVWATADALFDYVYKSMHREVMIQRRSWFEKPQNLYQVLWWVPAGHTPTVDEALERLDLLQEVGPNPRAFTFKSQFSHPDADDKPDGMAPEPYCSGWD